MENLSGYTPIELLKMSNDITEKHNALKQEIINHTIEVDELEKKINEKLAILDQLEKNYVAIMEELNNR
jgi:septal ring factor EnvC (AmiA/AmiB activator)